MSEQTNSTLSSDAVVRTWIVTISRELIIEAASKEDAIEHARAWESKAIPTVQIEEEPQE